MSRVKRRQLRAWVIVTILVGGVLVCLNLCNDRISDTAFPSSSYVGGADEVWKSLQRGTNEAEAVEQAGIAVAYTAPAWFDEEVPCDDFTVMYANDDWTIARIEASLGQKDTKQDFIAALCTAGWECIENEYEDINTFVKQGGTCTWLMFECREEQDRLSGVLHMLHD